MKQSLYRRTAISMFLIMIIMLVCILRVASVASARDYKTAAVKQSSYKISIGKVRGTVYDTNMKSLTNTKSKTVAAVTPGASLETLKDVADGKSIEELRKRLADGMPSTIEVKESVSSDGIASLTVPVNDSADMLASHIVGYTNSDGHGVSGIEGVYDDLLYCGESVGFLYTCMGNGNLVPNIPVRVFGDVDRAASGIRLTIDKDLQKITEDVADRLVSGAVVLAEVGTGKIRAIASRPNFDMSDIKKSMEADNSPFLNRAFCAYNVGSVFKPCVAAAALESGYDASYQYECVGSYNTENAVFHCHKRTGHGMVNMHFAIANSCNTFFYNLANTVGYSKIFDMATSLGFGQKYTFAPDYYTQSGCLPLLNEAVSSNALSNIAIGQGNLMLTPVSLLPLYEAIAGGGVYHRPSLVEGTVHNGVPVGSAETVPTRVMSADTAEIIKNALIEVISTGTGKSAAPKLCSAAGKTATAQTGWIKDGKTVDHSWFCGFFPAEAPRYVAVIISEDTSGGGTLCGPLFSKLADAVFSLKLS